MTRSTLTSKGQITVPKEIREALGLKPGDRVAFHVRENKVAEMEPESVPLMSLRGLLKAKGRKASLEDFDKGIAREVIARHRRRSQS